MFYYYIAYCCSILIELFKQFIIYNVLIIIIYKTKIAYLPRTFKMNKEIPSDINRLFHKEFDYIMDGVFRANEGELKNLFKKFLTDSELFVEYIKGDKDKDGIIGYQILPSYRTYPVYGHNGLVDGFIYKAPNQAKNENDDIDIIPFEKNQIGYETAGVVAAAPLSCWSLTKDVGSA